MTEPDRSQHRAHAQTARRLQAEGDWQAACAAWEQVLTRAPNDAVALANRAACLRRLGRTAEARAGYEASLSSDGSSVATWFNYANLLQAMGQRPAAEAAFRKALQLDDSHAPSLVNLAGLLRNDGRHEDALPLLHSALAIDPAQPQAHRMLARLLHGQGRLDEARAHYVRALSAQPRDPGLRSDYGLLLQRLGEHEAARQQWLDVLRARPESVEALNNLAALALQQNRPGEAQTWLERARAIRPDDPVTASNLAKALSEQGRIVEALAVAESGLRQHPAHPDLALIAGFASVHLGQIDRALERFLASAESATDTATPLSNALFASLYRDDVQPADELALHRRLSARLPRPALAERPPFPPLPRTRALRVGFVSPDFRSHAVACFFAPLLPHFDRNRIETVCYSVTRVEDAVTTRIREAAHHWRSAAQLNDAALGAQIRADACDILVDLAGHTAQNRLTLFRARPAPVQIGYIGYPATTGLPEMDWLIGDATLFPADAEQACSERLARLERPWVCYAPLDAAPEVTAPPALRQGIISFGSMNNCSKLSERTVELWSRVLLAVPGSRLLLRAHVLADAELRRSLPQRFARHGVEPSRILPLPPLHGQAATLAAYSEIDIALDPLPFNGFTTSCDALWMGVPLVTLAGATYHQRVGAALLQAIGEADCIARDGEDYVAIAQRLAGDTASLARLRSNRRARFHASPLGDPASLAESLSALFERLHDRS